MQVEPLTGGQQGACKGKRVPSAGFGVAWLVRSHRRATEIAQPSTKFAVMFLRRWHKSAHRCVIQMYNDEEENHRRSERVSNFVGINPLPLLCYR